jgi:putative oxidoreductase
MKAPFLIGRLIFGGFFIYNGINHLKNRKQLSQYVAGKKVPKPELAVSATGVMLIAGGTSIVLGVQPKIGAVAILAFLLGVSPTMHDFWKAEDPNQRMADMTNFAKNMALAGAALALMGLEEPWPASIPAAQPTKLKRLKRLTRRACWAA